MMKRLRAPMMSAIALGSVQAVVIFDEVTPIGYCISCTNTQGPIAGRPAGDCTGAGGLEEASGNKYEKPMGLACSSGGAKIPPCTSWTLCCDKGAGGWYACVKQLTSETCELWYRCAKICCTHGAMIVPVPAPDCGPGAFQEALGCQQ